MSNYHHLPAGAAPPPPPLVTLFKSVSPLASNSWISLPSKFENRRATCASSDSPPAATTTAET